MQESNKVANANKFTPKPGDKIICNNGEEFICCTPEFLKETFYGLVAPSEVIIGYNQNGWEWQGWDFNGQAEWGGLRYHIREVIPKSLEAPADKKEEVKEEPRYTVDEVFDAIFEVTKHLEIEIPWDYIDDVKEHLSRKDDPQYQEYLRLKAIYE